MVRPVVNAVQLLGFLASMTALSVLAGVGIFWMKSELVCAVDTPQSWIVRLLRGEPDKVSSFVFRALPFVVAYNLLLSSCVFVFCVWRSRAGVSVHRAPKSRCSNRRADAEREPLTESSSSKASWTTAQTSVTLMGPMEERRARVRLPMDISYYDNCHQAVSEAEFRQQLADETRLRRAADLAGF
uniref:Uncharacterized protein n=1 Tax=Plectus sambesii TaxID=2011161 RepID=A0A914W3G1_9BILA